jgi:hypothetical protein
MRDLGATPLQDASDENTPAALGNAVVMSLNVNTGSGIKVGEILDNIMTCSTVMGSKEAGDIFENEETSPERPYHVAECSISLCSPAPVKTAIFAGGQPAACGTDERDLLTWWTTDDEDKVRLSGEGHPDLFSGGMPGQVDSQ